jgi:uncharacterized membrane protein YkoI
MCRRTLSIIVACIILAFVPGSYAHGEEHGSSDSQSGEHGEHDNDGEADEIDGADGIDGEHDTARRAVEADEAISLGRMLAIFGASGDRLVVDITLVRQGQSLQYRIKYIDGEGRVRQARFDAQTGAAVP